MSSPYLNIIISSAFYFYFTGLFWSCAFSAEFVHAKAKGSFLESNIFEDWGINLLNTLSGLKGKLNPSTDGSTFFNEASTLLTIYLNFSFFL